MVDGEFDQNVGKAVGFIIHSYYLTFCKKKNLLPINVIGYSRGGMESVKLAQALMEYNKVFNLNPKNLNKGQQKMIDAIIKKVGKEDIDCLR